MMGRRKICASTSSSGSPPQKPGEMMRLQYVPIGISKLMAVAAASNCFRFSFGYGSAVPAVTTFDFESSENILKAGILTIVEKRLRAK